MFKINGQNLYLTRGDSAYLRIDIEGNTRNIQSLVLSVKKEVSDIEYAFQLTAIDNSFIFSPEDTKDLEYGKYYYDIQMVSDLGEVFTVVEKSNLYLKEEITI